MPRRPPDSAGSKVGLVVDEQRAAELLDQRLDRHTADLEPSVVADRGRVRQESPLDRAHATPPPGRLREDSGDPAHPKCNANGSAGRTTVCVRN